MRFAADDQGFAVSSRVMSRKMRSLRKSQMGHQLSAKEAFDLKASLRDIGRDEEGRGKGGQK